MSSTVFTICLIMAAVMITIHPVFSIPFIIGAFLITSKGNMEMDSATSIIVGIAGTLFLLSFIMIIRSWLK